MAWNSYFGKKKNRYYYYRSSGKFILHLIEDDIDQGLSAFQIHMNERIKLPELERLKAFAKKAKKANCTFFAPVSKSWKDDEIKITPWETLISLRI